MKLYEYAESYRYLLDQVESGEYTEDDVKDTLEAIGISTAEAVEQVGKIILEADAGAAALKAEEDRVKARRMALERKEAALKEYLKNALTLMGERKVKTPLITVSIRKNPDSVQLSPQFAQWAATAGRDDLLRYKEPEPDKRKILEALKAGEDLPASIVHSEGVTVR